MRCPNRESLRILLSRESIAANQKAHRLSQLLPVWNLWRNRTVGPTVWVFKSSSLVFIGDTPEVCSDLDPEHRTVPW